MGLGHALAQGFAALLLGYLVFIFVATSAIILAAYLFKRPWVLILVPIAAALPLVLYFGFAISALQKDNDRKEEYARARLIDEPAFEKICAEPISISVLKTTVAEDDRIVILDKESMLGITVDDNLRYLAKTPLYDGSPFMVSLRKFMVTEDSPYCNAPNGGRYQCHDPEYGYWKLPLDQNKGWEPVFSVQPAPRYTLETFKPVAIGKELTKREIVLSDSGQVLARTYVHRLEFDKKERRSCPDQSDAVKSMISQAFLPDPKKYSGETKN